MGVEGEAAVGVAGDDAVRDQVAIVKVDSLLRSCSTVNNGFGRYSTHQIIENCWEMAKRIQCRASLKFCFLSEVADTTWVAQ